MHKGAKQGENLFLQAIFHHKNHLIAAHKTKLCASGLLNVFDLLESADFLEVFQTLGQNPVVVFEDLGLHMVEPHKPQKPTFSPKSQVKKRQKNGHGQCQKGQILDLAEIFSGLKVFDVGPHTNYNGSTTEEAL